MLDSETANKRLQKRLEGLLNGRLTITLIVLDLDLSAHRPVQPQDAKSNTFPFMPHIAASAETGHNFGDFGLGKSTCHDVLTHLDEDDNDQLRFGRSVGTALEAFYERNSEALTLEDEQLIEGIIDDGSSLYVGPKGYCISIWSTGVRNVAILAVEQLNATPPTTPMTVRHMPNDLAKLVGQQIGDDRNGVTLEDIGFTIPGDSSRKPLSTIIARSSETIRGTRMARALTLVVETGMQKSVDRFLGMDINHNFDAVDEQQETGYVPQPRILQLAAEPSVSGSSSAASADGRLVLLNIDSMSVRHDYMDGLSGNLVSATMPVLCDLADTEAALGRLDGAVKNIGGKPTPLRKQLQLLNEVRLNKVHRHLTRTTVGHEKFVRWSNSGHLGSFLDEAYEGHREQIDTATLLCADIINSVETIRHQERDSWRAVAMTALTVAATILAGLGVLAALVVVPAGSWGWLSEFALVFVLVPILLLGVVLVPWWVRRPKR